MHIRQNNLLNKAIKKNEEGQYSMIKRSIQEKDNKLVKIYALI